MTQDTAHPAGDAAAVTKAEAVVDAPAPVTESVSTAPEVDTSENDDDDALSYFAKLAQQD